jgi:hypothetical protein
MMWNAITYIRARVNDNCGKWRRKNMYINIIYGGGVKEIV